MSRLALKRDFEVIVVRDLAETDEMSSDREIVAMPRRGREPVIIDLDEVENLAALQLTIEQICDYYGVSAAQLYKYRKKFDALDAAIAKGKAKGLVVAAQAVMKSIQAGNPISPFFLLKCKGGWKESQEVTQKQPVNNVKLYLPHNNRN
jgi:hypothetical protein